MNLFFALWHKITGKVLEIRSNWLT